MRSERIWAYMRASGGGRAEGQGAGGVDVDAGFDDPVLDVGSAGDGLTEGRALFCSLAHERQRQLGDADRAHAVLDSCGTEAGFAYSTIESAGP